MSQFMVLSILEWEYLTRERNVEVVINSYRIVMVILVMSNWFYHVFMWAISRRRYKFYKAFARHAMIIHISNKY